MSARARQEIVAEFTGPDAGNTAHYVLKCLSPDVCRDGKAVPWSETASATIGAQKLSAFSRQRSAGWLAGRLRR